MSSGVAPTISSGSGSASSLDTVFEWLRKHMVVNDLVQVHKTVKDLLKFVDPIQPCGHCHGRRLPLNRVHELVTRFPQQRKALTSQLILAKLLPPNTDATAETPPPDFAELWCAVKHGRADWVRWWIHQLPLTGCSLAEHDARLLVNATPIGTQGSSQTVVFLGPRSLPSTFPSMLSSVVVRSPPHMQELILQELARRGVIARQEVSFLAAAAAAEVTRNLAKKQHTGNEVAPAIRAAAAAASALMAPILDTNAGLGSPVTIAHSLAEGKLPRGALRAHPHDVSASAGFSPIDFTRVALRLTRAGLLFALRDDSEPIALTSPDDTRTLDAMHKLEMAQHALTRASMLQALVPFGRLTPFHRFMCTYLHKAGLQSALTVYRAWYQLPAVDADDLLHVKYSSLLPLVPNFLSESEKHQALISAFNLQLVVVPVQYYGEWDNLKMSFFPENFQGLHFTWSPQRPVCLNSLIVDLGYSVTSLLAQASTRTKTLTSANSDAQLYMDFFHRLGSFWLSRGAPTMAIASLLSNVRLVEGALDPFAMHTLRHRLCVMASLIVLRNFDPARSTRGTTETLRQSNMNRRAKDRAERRRRIAMENSARGYSAETDDDDDDEDDDEDDGSKKRGTGRKNNKDRAGAKGSSRSGSGSSGNTQEESKLPVATSSTDARIVYLLRRKAEVAREAEDPQLCMEWLAKFTQLNEAVHTFLIMTETYDSYERARHGIAASTFYASSSSTSSSSSSSSFSTSASSSFATPAKGASPISGATGKPLSPAKQSHFYSLCLVLMTVSSEWIFQASIPLPPGRQLPEQVAYAFSEGMERMRQWNEAADLGMPWLTMGTREERMRTSPALEWFFDALVEVYRHTYSASLRIPTAGHVLRVLTTMCLAFYVPFPDELDEWWEYSPLLDPDIPHEGPERELTNLILNLLESGMRPCALMGQMLAFPSRPGIAGVGALGVDADSAAAGADGLSDAASASASVPRTLESVVQHMCIFTQREQAWLSHLLFAAPGKGKSLPLQALLDLSTKPSRFFLAWPDPRDRELARKADVAELALYRTQDGSAVISGEGGVRNPLYAGLADVNAQRLEKTATTLVMWLQAGQFNMMRLAARTCFPNDPIAHFINFLVAFQRRLYTRPPALDFKAKVAPRFLPDSIMNVLSAANAAAGGAQGSQAREEELTGDAPIEYHFSQFASTLRTLEAVVESKPRSAGLIKVDGRKVWLGQASWSKRIALELWIRFIDVQSFLTEYERQYLENLFMTYGWTDGLERMAKLQGGLSTVPASVATVSAKAAAEQKGSTSTSSSTGLGSLSELTQQTYLDLHEELTSLAAIEELGGVVPADRASLIDNALQETHRANAPTYLRAAFFYQVGAALLKNTSLPPSDADLACLLGTGVNAAESDNPKEVAAATAAKLNATISASAFASPLLAGSGVGNPMASGSISTSTSSTSSIMDAAAIAAGLGPENLKLGATGRIFAGAVLRSQMPVHPIVAAQLAQERREAALQVIRALMLAALAWKAILDKDTLERSYELSPGGPGPTPASRLVPLGEPAIGRLSYPARAHMYMLVRRCSARALWLMTVFDIFSVNLGPRALLDEMAMSSGLGVGGANAGSGTGSSAAANATDSGIRFDLQMEDSVDVIISRTQLQEKYDRDVAALQAKLVRTKNSSTSIPVSLLGLEDFPLIPMNSYVPWKPQDVIARRQQLKSVLQKKRAMERAIKRQQRAQRRLAKKKGSDDEEDDEDEDDETSDDDDIDDAADQDDEELFDDSPDLNPQLIAVVLDSLLRRAQIRSAIRLVSELHRRPAGDRARHLLITPTTLALYHFLHFVAWTADSNLDLLEVVGGRRSLAAEFVRVPWPPAPEPSATARTDGGLSRQDWTKDDDAKIPENSVMERVLFYLHGSASEAATAALATAGAPAGAAGAGAGGVVSTSGAAAAAAGGVPNGATPLTGSGHASVEAPNAIDRALRELWKRCAATGILKLPWAKPKPGATLTFLQAQSLGKPEWGDIRGLLYSIHELGVKGRMFLLEELMRLANKYIVPAAAATLAADGTSFASAAAASMLSVVPQLINMYHQGRSIATTEERPLLDAKVRAHFARVGRSVYGNVPVARSTHVAAALGLISSRARPVALSSWQPSTLDLVQRVAAKYELSPVTILGAAPSALLVEIFARHYRVCQGLPPSDPATTLTAGATDADISNAAADGRARAIAAARAGAGGMSTSASAAAAAEKEREKELAKEKERERDFLEGPWPILRDLFSSGQMLLHVRAHFFVQRQRVLASNAALPPGLTFGRSKQAAGGDAFEALTLESLIDALVGLHKHKTMRLGLAPQWTLSDYQQFVNLAPLINPWSGSVLHWQRRVGNALWARLHFLFPTPVTGNRTCDSSQEPWRWVSSALERRGWMDRIHVKSSRASIAAAGIAHTRAATDKSLQDRPPVQFHLPSEMHTLELQVELLITAFVAYQEAFHSTGLLYTQMEMYQREAFKAGSALAPPSSRPAHEIWERAHQIVPLESREELEMRVKALQETSILTLQAYDPVAAAAAAAQMEGGMSGMSGLGGVGGSALMSPGSASNFRQTANPDFVPGAASSSTSAAASTPVASAAASTPMSGARRGSFSGVGAAGAGAGYALASPSPRAGRPGVPSSESDEHPAPLPHQQQQNAGASSPLVGARRGSFSGSASNSNKNLESPGRSALAGARSKSPTASKIKKVVTINEDANSDHR